MWSHFLCRVFIDFRLNVFSSSYLTVLLFLLIGLTIEEREELALLIAEEERLDLQFREEVHEDIEENGILSQNDSVADSENFFETESSPIRVDEIDEDVEKNSLVENLNSNFFETLTGRISENCDTDLRNDNEDNKFEIKDVIEFGKSDAKISSVINDLITKIESEEETANKIFNSPIVEVGTCYSPLMKKEEEINIQINPLRNLLSSAKKNEKKSDSNFSNSKSTNFGNSLHWGKKTVKSTETENKILDDEKNENSSNSVKNLILKFNENEMKKEENLLIEKVDGKNENENEMMSLSNNSNWIDINDKMTIAIDSNEKKIIEEENKLNNSKKNIENPSDLLVKSIKKILNPNPLFPALSHIDEAAAWTLDLLANSPSKVRNLFFIFYFLFLPYYFQRFFFSCFFLVHKFFFSIYVKKAAYY